MNTPTPGAGDLFAEAIQLTSGTARKRFLDEQCPDDSPLRREVESLLRAHDASGDFLGGPKPRLHPSSSGTAVLTPGALSPADCAGAFLREHEKLRTGTLEQFLATVPEELRREIRERIDAACRVRQFRASERPAEPIEEALPLLPGFTIERKLGEGSVGVVYAAHDEKLNRRVAIKVLRRSRDEQVRLLDEARKAAALSDPAIVTVFSVLDDTTPGAIVMELVEGFPLDRFASQLTFGQKAHLLREIARGLGAAHEHGLVHRDLKPDNIIVGPDMRPRILDFGIALSLAEAGREGRGFEGTPLYASPEQVRGKPLTAASDVFSFGSLMFKVLTGRAPFTGETVSAVLAAIATTAPPFLREVAVGVPEDLQAICLACLAWDPGDRPTASEVALELGRFLVGEPVRLKPRLYDDVLRRSISEYSSQARAWESQSIISREERDALETVHRRLLADEDHWIIEARRITLVQTILSGATWLAVVATVLIVWKLRIHTVSTDELGAPWRWILPAFFTSVLFVAGYSTHRQRENLAAATFLAGATLAVAPCVLSLLAELHWFGTPADGVTQLFNDQFSNQQVFVASLIALIVSVGSLWRLKMTGFAWTTATMAATSYLSFLLLFNWLDQKPEIQALWCLPLAAMEPMALALEWKGRVRWTLPFHLVALLALVAGLDVMAQNGPTLTMLGVDQARWAYFDHNRQVAFSFVLNGLFFLAFMLVTERSKSLDLRRASRLLEILAIVHTLSALFVNAMSHRGGAFVHVDVWLYLGAAALFLVLAPFRSRWRLLVGGLLGCGLGCYLLVELDIVTRKPFIVGLGFTGLLVALGTFTYARRRASAGGK